MANQPRAAFENRAVEMAANIPDGLSALHVAVLQNNHEQARALLKSREFGVDVRASTGTTPLMLAALYGRTRIFYYLVKKRADLEKRDHNNFATIQYTKGPHAGNLIRKYQDIATGEPRRSGRHAIYCFLKTLEHASQNAPRRQPTDARPEDARLSHAPLPSTVFLRSHDGKQLELVGVHRLAITSVDIDMGRKSTGTIRGKCEADKIHKFAISGWAGVNGENVLCNKEYSALVRRVCSMYGFELQGNWLDNRWRGDPAEKRGAYLSSHAEKQLGVWVLVEALSQALGTRELTVERIEMLKELSPQLPARLRETLIELDHEPCASCINFLKLLQQKAGLVIGWKSRKWFVDGQRSQLRRRDGHPLPVNARIDEDIMENEIDENENENEDEDEDEFDNSSVTMDHEDDAADNAEITAANQAIESDPSTASGAHQYSSLHNTISLAIPISPSRHGRLTI
ncbi:hypothetical protein VM1G_01229 [Cytospora mali]|uniref:Single-strand DNA deaminase toxin A-like C-terminal domain-containing protein n=1 Tax=Cytospora mali TaxID=578113 RepID=A0A194VLR4_CYTMA|nr:hypothetical protein VM1G_01229 [Valsa mali]